MDAKPQSQDPIHQLPARAALSVGNGRRPENQSGGGEGDLNPKSPSGAQSQFFPHKAGLGPSAWRREQGRKADPHCHSPIESEMVFSVSDEGRVGGQEMAVQEFPCLEHTLCGGLG